MANKNDNAGLAAVGTDTTAAAPKRQAHTPGPWGFDYGDYVSRDGGRGEYVAELITQWEHPNLADPDRTNANGFLIAAAPDLLEACRDLVDRFERKATSKASLSCSYTEAKRAIAKAEGRS